MKSYFRKQGARLFRGDVSEVLQTFRPESVDLIFADPPYKLSNGGFTCKAGKRAAVHKGAWDKSKGFKRDSAFHERWIAACRRVLKPDGSLWISGTYHSIYACGYALQRQGWHILNEICWYKPNAAPNLSCRMFTASHETLLWARRDKKARHTFNYKAMKDGSFPEDPVKKAGRQMRSLWALQTPRNGEKKFGRHPTQKPEALLERIILASSKREDLVLDPFCGSATTGVVALRNERRFIGVDLSREYLDKMAIPRIEETFASS